MYFDSKSLSHAPKHEHIFCNRPVNMRSIKAVGFDMDYTLVLYKPYSFEKLVYSETVKKLVTSGYPNEMLSWEFDPSCAIRGLLIDKKRGNILKLDRYRFVKIAYHGCQRLSQEERHALYDVEKIISYQEPDFAFLDTFFSLVESFLFSKLVEYKDKNTNNSLKEKSYSDFYYDVRKNLDLSHRDDTIKYKVAQNPEEYIEQNPLLPNLLNSLKQSGKKLFILSNSLWEYVNPIMSYLLPPNASGENKEWTSYFDFVMTGAQKPQFFSSKNLMYEVDPSNGFLKNLPVSLCPTILQNTKIFQGGHVQQFHNMLSVSRGSEVLYVGDHIYGDILQSKKSIGWRTMLIIDELENEIKQKFHPVWGSLMKTGTLNSLFSAQVEKYSCLYTSNFTNFKHYKVTEKFQAKPNILPHDCD